VTVCGVVLAAGASRRFGGAKQLAELNGRPLAQWAIDAACRARSLDRVIVVLGARADAIEARIEPGRAQLVRCAGAAEGIAASLRCGFAAAEGAEWVVVTLADEPRLPPEAIERVVRAALAAPAEVPAVRARWGTRPGHPVALSARVAARVDALRGDHGARDLIADVACLEVQSEDLGDPRDVDTREDLEEASR
jgi:CTP:molybdopterin cytidylyltransferase MocA